MSQTYSFTDLLLFIEEDVLLGELINDDAFETDVKPSFYAINNILNYSKVLNISRSGYCKNIEMILN